MNTDSVKDAAADGIFILPNTGDKKNTMPFHISAQELQYIKCPRCKYIIDRAINRLQDKNQNYKNEVIGVCGHCRSKSIPQIVCYECEDIAKKFMTNISEGSDDSGIKHKAWIANVKHLLKSSRINEERADRNIPNIAKPHLNLGLGEDPQIKMRLKSKTYKIDDEEIPRLMPDIKKIYRARSFDSYLQQFEDVTNFKSTSLKSGKQYGPKSYEIISPGARDYYPPDKKYVSYYDSVFLSDRKHLPKPDRRTLLDMQDSYHQVDSKFGSEPESWPRTVMDGYDSRYRQYKRHLLAPVENYNKQSQKTSLEKYTLDTEKHDKSGAIKDTKTKATKSVKVIWGNTSDLTSSYRASSKTSMKILRNAFHPVHKSLMELYSSRKPENGSLKSHDYHKHMVSSTMPRIKTGKKTKDVDITSLYYSPNKTYPYEDALSPSISLKSETVLRKDFSYQFPQGMISKKEPNNLPTSAELIKETQDMLKVKEEDKIQKIENERARKLLEAEIQNKAREEKKRLQKEKREDIRTDEEKKTEEERHKREEEKKIEYITMKQRSKDEKKTREVDRIKPEEKTKVKLSVEEKEKAKNKEKTKAEREEAKEKRKHAEDEKHKTKKETREKTKSEKISKEKGYEVADQLKEIKLTIQKGEKQRAKDEKERLKKEKEEQLKAKKDQTQRKKEGEINKQLEVHKGKIDIDAEMNESKSKSQKVESPRDHSKQNDQLALEDLKKIHGQSNDTDEALKKKKKILLEICARDEADKKAKGIEKLGKVHGKIPKSVINPESAEEIIKADKIHESPTIQELDKKQIKVRRPSYDDLISKLIKLKQSETRERVKQIQLPVLDIPRVAREHKKHKYTKASKCLMCVNSEFELDVDDVLMKTNQPREPGDIIIGQKIFKYKPIFDGKEEKVPFIFPPTFQAESSDVNMEKSDIIVSQEPEHKSPTISVPAKSQKLTDQEAPKGIVRYALSDRTFIEKGWTMLPTEKVVRKMNVYRMRPAHPEFDWFEHNRQKKLLLYDTGEKLADFDNIGRSRLYYKNGRLALDYYDAEEINAQQRFVVFSSGELDERGRSYPITILATFDFLGNGIVFDHSGKIRLKYNQTEGVVLDRNIGPVSHWKWHTLNDPPVLQKVMIDTQIAHKDPEILKLGGLSDNKSRRDNDEMLAIEFDNFIKEKSKKLTQNFKPFQIKTKALKINEHFSLKILDQATIYLIFRDGTTNVKINIGMILDHKEIVDTDTAEVGEVSNNLERFPARTESLAGLQRSVAFAQRFEKSRLEREQRLRPPEPCTSADQINAASSRPLRPPLRSAATTSTVSASSCRCSRKPCSSNVYYDTRLI